MTPEQEKYYVRQLQIIRGGGDQHGAWAQDKIFGLGSSDLGPITPPVVGFGQSGDPYYTQYFQNWGEVNTLINELKAEAVKAWGEEKNT
jgi:hypothetical protein